MSGERVAGRDEAGTEAGRRLLAGLRAAMGTDTDRAAIEGEHGVQFREQVVEAVERALPDIEREAAAPLIAALQSVTDRHGCGHGYTDVYHVAPFHFDGPACPTCSDAPYADDQQRRHPCPICAALGDVR